MSYVVLKNLVKNYPVRNGPDQAVVKAINLEVRQGEFMVLVGPSGCGKSTTLRMIAGLEEISGGSISIDGRVVNDVLPKDRDIAMVFQNYALYPHLSVYDNMAFALKLRKHPPAEIKARVHEAAALLGLEAYLDRRPKALSGGQRQRVAVGRAIVRQPKVFLFDEPLSNLDAKMRGAMRAELARLHARLQATIIYVTHDQVEAMTMGDRICVMKDGEIMQVDEPLALYHRPKSSFVGGFIGSPPMNFIQGGLRRVAGNIHFVERETATAPLDMKLTGDLAEIANRAGDRPVMLGVRPEDIHEGGPAVIGQQTIAAQVEIAESMGSETLLYLTTGATSLVARVGPALRYSPGQRVEVSFDLTKAILFDGTTGRSLAGC